MRKATDLQTLLRDADQKDQEIKSLRQELIEYQRKNERLNQQNIEMKLKMRSEINNPPVLQKARTQLYDGGRLSKEEYEKQLVDYKQQKEQERRKERQSYELRIDELVRSLVRYKDLAKMWEFRCLEQAASLEQSRRRQHDLNVIIGNKKILIFKACRILGEHFNQKVQEGNLFEKINELIEIGKQIKDEADIYAGIMSSIGPSRIF